MVEKDTKFRLMVANGGKTHYFQRGSRSPWISAEVKNPSTIAFSHFDPQDPPVGVSRKGAPVFVLRQHPSCLPRALTLLTASARPCGTLLESLKMPCPRFPTQTVESVCVESGFRNACKPTWAVLAEGPVRRRPPMSMRCVTACELLDISECYW